MQHVSIRLDLMFFALWGLSGQQCLIWVETSYYMCKATKRPRAPATNLRCRSDRGAIWGPRAGRQRLGWFSGIFKQVHRGLGQSCLTRVHVACINPFSWLYFLLTSPYAPPGNTFTALLLDVFVMHIVYLNTACSLLFLFYKPIWNGQENMH